MKFMKLGSKPDAFHSDYDSYTVRCVSSDLVTDFTVIVDNIKFHLHKFPLLSKSNRLQKLALTATEDNSNDVHLIQFPGGPKIFEICAKFCYGMTVSISPYNVVAVRCAAEYLEMTEDIERGNLIFKIDVFFYSSILSSWKDSIIALQTTTALPEYSEDLEITSKCIQSVVLKTAVDPACVNWSYTYNRKLDAVDKVQEVEIGSVPKDWWIEDLCELDVDVYKRVMFAVIAKKRVEGGVIGEALKMYCVRWLPDCNDRVECDDRVEKYKSLIEAVISLLTHDKGVDCSCSFLLKLLKVSVLVGVDRLLCKDLIRDIGLKLDEASVRDLLIPAEDAQTVYDVALVQELVDLCFSRKSSEEDEKNDVVLISPQRCKTIGRLIDGYLAEVASDRNLSHTVFTALSRSIPDAARSVHDGIYGAVDVYLKEHPALTKVEKKKVCELIDVKKLSAHASIHAAQNDRLPLRMVVQILFHEQVRATAAIKEAARAGRAQEQDWEIKMPLRSKSLRTPSRMRFSDGDVKDVSSGGSMRLLPSSSRRFLDRFWVVGMGQRHGESKSTGTSGSSQSKSSSSSSRKQRYSIS
ncbi:putative BTB/POZ domain, NPH3 domain, NPH3/RPT2-like family protein [Helianthus annuus]|nr:putative BTB/POZ domain, NPH3 domain, NPH3/RPT2-like family protein [Helianthus annuus]KAJ0737489.1 putative BTB/POZ domain, NPH3 domain, NPH3/RPT2-like family protein [Helianthus annuus]